ncbi:cell division protein FtsQ/DivIB [Acrocarpospora catenulata]|uniref:cell division protein FtsQ/DivIB n=1 Tax=Acrocarpospora catenulata TaxID=2836182 RepID=UPI0027E1CC88|nr:FtsQ-type POTRA domain-containing protein [Acrocarpospora catenulata]
MRKSLLWRTALATLPAGAAVAAAAWVVFLSPVLGVREVVVTGNLTLPAEQVRRAAAVAPDTPLVTVDLEQVRARVAALRAVESARVVRDWPGTLRIKVVERTPLASARMSGKMAVVDRFGVVLDLVDVAPPRLPLLRVHRLDPADPAVRAALAVLDALPESLSRLVDEVSAGSAENVTFRLNDGRTVVWGGRDRAADKSRILTTLLRESAMTFDVSSPDVVTVK